MYFHGKRPFYRYVYSVFNFDVPYGSSFSLTLSSSSITPFFPKMRRARRINAA
ncbi:hypothetical protein HM1_2471 [Heliomicrobium modesticaldum Ice1]|uniref:Uncharacterized protein n=1 Tax=Heliobacterium modesticaldum (strain ATCC 51547 / Ice1) TaxID=498761 RepID=B0TAH1_HELMI|nr:hypothetical protein HM1_2471 [Heliomicrobium modesticaldum Ice1]